jgi:hypothetical protein
MQQEIKGQEAFPFEILREEREREILNPEFGQWSQNAA